MIARWQRRALLLGLLLWALLAGTAWAAPQGFYRQPALQGDQVYLVAEGDLWRAASNGGAAQRLHSSNSSFRHRRQLSRTVRLRAAWMATQL